MSSSSRGLEKILGLHVKRHWQWQVPASASTHIQLAPSSSNLTTMSSKVHRYYTVAHKLSTLPPELVHEVLSDLPLSKILELISAHQVPYLDTCVLTHIHLGKIFTSEDSLRTIKQYFTLYLSLCQHRHGRNSSPNPNIPYLQRDAYSFILNHDAAGWGDAILAQVKAFTLPLLDAYTAYLPALSRFSTEPIPDRQHWDVSDPVSLSNIWEVIEGAETSLNAVKSKQLLQVAEILAKYPGMLRSYRDSSQESRRHSLQHRIDEFERAGRAMKGPQVLGCLFVSRSWFSQHRLPLVPYDRYLVTFLKVLEKFPLQLDPKKVPKYVYPSEIVKAITIAIQGMATINTKESVEGGSYSDRPIMRTKYTSYSARDFKKPGGLYQPRFTDYRDDIDIETIPLTENDKVLPLEEREFEWLVAFLESCRFMREMSDVEWKPGMTVKVFWKSHTGETSEESARTVVQAGYPVT